MKYLVTGGAGFIGSNFVRHLLKERPAAEVVTLDALTYAGHLESLAGVLDDPRHRFIHGDVCDGELVRDVVSGVNTVFHLAAETHVDRSILAEAPFVRTNVLGTATMLAAALDAGVERFVACWSSPRSIACSAGGRRVTTLAPVAPSRTSSNCSACCRPTPGW